MPKGTHSISAIDLVTSEIVGPSSSHTTGVMRIGRDVFKKVKNLRSIVITLYNSLADTGDAHMTKSALVAGLMGWDEEDPRIPFSFKYAEDAKLTLKWHHKRELSLHPNTVSIIAFGESLMPRTFVGVSIGGGRYKIKEVHLK